MPFAFEPPPVAAAPFALLDCALRPLQPFPPLVGAPSVFPHINAGLNALALMLLVLGYVLIRRRRETAHKATMLACFGVSVAFLTSYLIYHLGVKDGVGTRFPDYPPTWIRLTYYAVLISHIVLAALVPVLALVTIYFGFRDWRRQHRGWARWTFPIWVYVSVTGVLVYVMLYHLYPPR